MSNIMGSELDQTALSVFDVFTPTAALSAAAIARPAVSSAIAAALAVPGRQLLLYGQTGSGKSTALFQQLMGHMVVVRCTPETTLASVLSVAVQRYGIETYGDPIGTLPAVAAALGKRGLRVVIEDAHRLEKAERARMFSAMKLFSDLGNRFPALMIIAIAAVDSTEVLGHVDIEFSSRIAEVRVPGMTARELSDIVTLGGDMLNVSTDQIAGEIAQISGGMPSVAHALALDAFMDAGITHGSDEHRVVGVDSLDRAIDNRLTATPSHVTARFDAVLARQRDCDATRTVLTALAEFEPDGVRVATLIDHLRRNELVRADEYVPDIVASLVQDGSVVVPTTDGRVRFAYGLLHSHWSLLTRQLPAGATPRN